MIADRLTAARGAIAAAVLTIACVAALLATTTRAPARDFGQWDDADPEVRAWFKRQQTTPEWRQRVGLPWYQYCCDHADTVTAEFGKRAGKWFFRTADDGDWHPIPDDTVQADVMTPGGRSILFVDKTGRNLGATCFFPGGTGT